MSKIENFLEQNFGFETFKPGLERINNFLKYDISKLNSKVITIAGTNGKGECSFTLAKLFDRADLKYAVWSSPHIESITERFLFNGSYIDEELLYKSCLEVFDSMKSSNISLSYYEFLFAVFIKQCVSLSPEFIILEVGLGGRLDAVNIVDADITAITSISRDHQEYLGSSLKGILKEKFLVSRAGKALITSFKSHYLRSEVVKLAKEHRVSHLDLCSEGKTTDKNYSESNRLIALELFTKLTNINNLPTLIELMSFSFRGRFDRIFKDHKELVCCGAHNLDGLRQMFSLICENDCEKYKDFTLLASFSKRNTADLTNMIKVVKENSGLFSKIRFSEFDHIKAAELIDLDESYFQKDWKEIIKHDDKLFITGSYYFIGQVKESFNCLSSSI